MAGELFKKNIENAHLPRYDVDLPIEIIAVALIKKLWQDEGPFIHITGLCFFSQETGWKYQIEFVKDTFEIRKLKV